MTQAIGEEHMMMMAMMMMMKTVMITHHHFGSMSSFAVGQADFKVDDVRAICLDSPRSATTTPWRGGLGVWLTASSRSRYLWIVRLYDCELAGL